MVKSKPSMTSSMSEVPYGAEWPLDGSHELTDDEVGELVHDWVGIGYRVFRKAFNGDPSTSDLDARRVATFDRWLDGGSYSGDIHRGINVKDDVLAEFRAGAVIDQMGPSAWSAKRDVADTFSGWNDYNKVVFHMSGTSHGRSLVGVKGNIFGKEREVTVSSQSKQRITARRKRKNGIIDIYLEEV